MQHTNYIFGRLWPFGWSESICTLYKSSYSTSSIDPLHLCNSEPILHSIGIHILYSISIITLQGLYRSAGLRAYPHYIRPQKAHPSFTNCVSSKLQPIQLLCMHTYFMQHISHFLAKLWPFGWAESLFTPYITSWSTPLLWLIASLQRCSSSSTIYAYILYSMQHINYIFAKLWPFGWSKSILTLYKST